MIEFEIQNRMQEHKNYQVDENRKISRIIDLIERKILEKRDEIIKLIIKENKELEDDIIKLQSEVLELKLSFRSKVFKEDSENYKDE